MAKDLKKLPGNIRFVTGGKIELQATGDDKKTPTFSMLAYTGGLMRVGYFDLPVVVDLEGMEIERQNIPIRMDHDEAKGVGHSTEVSKTNGEVTASGLISRNTQWARDVAESGKNGFPWQASIGAAIHKYEYIQPDTTIVVNGQDITGECYVVRASTLKEISFVDSGADSQTEAEIIANNNLSKGALNTMTDEEKKAAAAEKAKLDAKAAEDAKLEAKAAEDKKKLEAKTPDNTPDPIADMRKEAALEATRIADVTKLCGGEHADIQAKAIGEGWTKDKTELAVLRASRANTPAIHIKVDKATPKIMEAAALMTTGVKVASLEASYDEQTLEAADKYRGIGIQEMCMLTAGMPLPSFRRDPQAWLQAAFSTASIPGLLSNIANKSLLEGFSYADNAWREVCKIASVNDFKEHTRYRMLSDFTFAKVGQDGELKHGKISEESFGNKADTHGILFSITRQMMINDDLSALTQLPFQIGLGAGDAINDAVWPLLLSLVTSGFFATGKSNYATGAGTVLGIDGLSVGRKLFMKMPAKGKAKSRPSGIRPSIILVPSALEDLALTLMKAAELNETTAEGVPSAKTNIHKGRYKVVSTEYIGGDFLSAGSDLAWYLFADPRIKAALEVAFLGGKDSPTVERADANFDTLGIQMRGYLDFGTREQDEQGAIKMKGEA